MVQEPLVVTHAPHVVVAPAAVLEAGHHQPPPTAEQARLADEIFRQEESQEADLIAGLIGMHAGVLILHDVVLDTLTTAPDEGERRRRRLQLPEQPET